VEESDLRPFGRAREGDDEEAVRGGSSCCRAATAERLSPAVWSIWVVGSSWTLKSDSSTRSRIHAASSSSPSLALPKGIRSRLEVSKSKVQLVSTTQKLQLMVVTLPAVSSRLPLEPLQTAFSSSPSPALLRDIQSRLEVLRSRFQLETIRLLLEVVSLRRRTCRRKRRRR
jgi:hypothetical protein